MISIIIRSKNEEKWISSCLESIFKQNYKDFEVILVDNGSSDRTVEKARRFAVKEIIAIADFLPGLAINRGVRASSGEYLVCLSAHCIPVDEFWLENLLRNFEDPEVAGVYGRQEPMAFTNDLDKRDLINVFGLDRKVQRKDPFFHNANSMIRRAVWERYPFDEKVTNIEDRVWAKQVLAAGYKIVYEPEASVYHYHGINQGRNVERAKNVVRVLEQIHAVAGGSALSGLNVTAIIPLRGEVKNFKGQPLLSRAIRSARDSRYINRIIVASDNPRHLDIAGAMNAETLLRPASLSADYVGLEEVYRYVLGKISEKNSLPDLLVLLEEIYPFRPRGLIDDMIETLLPTDYDSVIAAHPGYDLLWKKNGDGFARIDSGMMPSKFKEPVYVGSIGLATVTHPAIVQQGDRIGSKVGLVTVDNPFSMIKISGQMDLTIAESVEPRWEEFQKNGPVKQKKAVA